MENKIQYRSKRLLLLIIYNSIFIISFGFSLFYIQDNLISLAIILYSLYLIYELLWTCFGEIQVKLMHKYLEIKKNLFFYSFSNKKYLLENINNVKLLKNADSNKRLGFPGMYFSLKYDYCIELDLKNHNKNQQFEVNDKVNGEKILKFINNKIKTGYNNVSYEKP